MTKKRRTMMMMKKKWKILMRMEISS